MESMNLKTLEQTFTVIGPARLTLVNIVGSIDIQPGDEGLIQVRAVKHSGAGDADRTQIEMTQAEDGAVTVATRYRDRSGERLLHRRQPCRVNYTVRIPRTTTLKVEGVTGPISVEGLVGQFDIRTVEGPLHMKDLSGALHVQTVSGQVVGARLQVTERLRLQTVSGDVHLSESTLPAVEGSAVSGNLILHSSLADGPYAFQTVSGDVRLVVPPTSGCSVEIHSLSGRLRSALPVTRRVVDRGAWRADVQGGGPEVRLHTVSGNLDILLSEQDAATGAADVSPTSTIPIPPSRP